MPLSAPPSLAAARWRTAVRTAGAVGAAALLGLATVPQARAEIGTLTATNVSRVPRSAAGTPLAPGIGRVRAVYDPAGVVGLNLSFAHPLNRVARSRYAAWSVAVAFGAGVPGSLTGCRPVIVGSVAVAAGQTGTLRQTGDAAVAVTPTVHANAMGFTVGDERLAGADVACLRMSMTGWRRVAAGATGAQRIASCGCWAIPQTVDRLRSASGEPVVWFAGRRPQPPPPPLRTPTARIAWIATITTPVGARSGPGTGHIVDRLGTASDIDGGPDALLVLGARRDAAHRLWIRVRLDIRPNTASGWIPAGDATLATTAWRIDVTLATRTVRVFDAGRLHDRFLAVIGKPSTPTPTGLFAVAAIVPQPDPSGFLGPVALHLTAHSNVLDNYGGGPGRVAIHGRGGASLRDPLGSARSHGCVRVDNRWAELLAGTVPIGTPVIVH